MRRDDPRVPVTLRLAVFPALALLAAACGGGAGGAAPPTSGSTSAPATTTVTTTSRAVTTAPVTQPASTTRPTEPPATSAPATSAPATTTTTGPGSLPQTDVLPSAASAQFRDEMRDLWEGVQDDSPERAAPAFFPEAAYVQLKSIPYPESDFVGRLFADYGLDLAAAHALLGAGAEEARLLYVSVPSGEAEWIPPGYCYNSIGYWHEPGARLVYEEDGQVRSFGIASLISWRGVWYVVHLGAVLRSDVVGMVDDPAVGPGEPGPPGGC